MRGEEGIWEGRAGEGCEGQWARDGRFDMRTGKGKGESGGGQGLMEWKLNLNTVRHNKLKGCYTLGYNFRGCCCLN